MVISLPVYLPNRIRSPTETSRGTLLPFSNLPAPAAITSPSCGFSLAVSGMMMPPFAVSFSSSLRTSTRSCNGVTFTVILSLRVIYVLNAPRDPSLRSKARTMGEALLILLPSKFGRIRFLVLALDGFLRGFQLVRLHYLCKRRIRVRIDSFRVNDQLKGIGKRRSHEIEGILRVFPGGNRLLSQFILLFPFGVNLHRNAFRRAKFCRNRFHHIVYCYH